MSTGPSLVFIHGSWHKPACYDKVVKSLQDNHNIKCVAITLPSTCDNPNATFKDDIDTARNAIISETTQGHNVIVIAHSYGGMVGNSAIKGLTRLNSSSTSSHPQTQNSGYVVALVLIASGFTISGWSFMDPAFGMPLPWFRVDKETGYAVLTVNPREFFYHDLPDDEAAFWVSQLTTQSMKALFEGGEHAYAGWQDVPNWYIGTVEDVGLSVVLQRLQVGTARSLGAVVHHTELMSSHSPFLSMPEEVVQVLLQAVKAVSGPQTQVGGTSELSPSMREGKYQVPTVRLNAPNTWIRFGIPYFIGRMIGWGFLGFMGVRRLLRK